MDIPRIVHQTYVTTTLPSPTLKVISKMKEHNPEFKFILYDDNAMDLFMKNNFQGRVYDCFLALNIGAAKADLWRYCVLYKIGGVYLDIDAQITGSLNELIGNEEEAIISREKNMGSFLQWMLVYPPAHEIMKRTIELCCERIENRVNNIIHATGPAVYTEAINEVIQPHLVKKVNNLWHVSDKSINEEMSAEDFPIKCRFFGKDYGKYGKFKYSGFKELYNEWEEGIIHWSVINNLYKY